MDSATDGVIVFSLGSHVSMENTLGPEKINVFKTFFRKIKQKVLWKVDSDLNDLPPNVKTTKWFPQTDVLGKNKYYYIIKFG